MNTKIDINYKWDTEYNDFINYLFSIRDIKYKNFQGNLGIDKETIIGIKIPILKDIAKKIAKKEYKSFIKNNKHKYFEEILIHGLIIGYLKDYTEAIHMLNDYLPYISNWALCDSTCANFKLIKNNLDKTYPLILSYLYDENPWVRRVGIVLLLNFYVNDEYIDNIIIEFSKIKLDDYYVKMALAWLIQVCYIKYPIKTIDFLRFNKIDNWTHNKAIQKIRESLKVTPKEKEKLNYLKRGINNE